MTEVSLDNLSAATTAANMVVSNACEIAELPGLGSRHALYIDSPIYRRKSYGPQHPLRIARTETVAELCRTLGWLPIAAVRESTAASLETLQRFHCTNYIEALCTAESSGRVARDVRERYRIGTMENPLFDGVFARAATTVGGSILAAKLALEGRIAFHPAGGTHHGRPDRASGFCYFNDPVFALLTVLDAGLDRVLYVDIDAHHGDGVEDALQNDPRVFMVSVHEMERWPYTGTARSDISGRICNLPVAMGCSDCEFDYLMAHIVLPYAVSVDPQAIVITCGTDALAGDPLSTMSLSNTTLWRAVEHLSDLAKAVVVLGGGGYNPWTLARCWSGLWARLAEFDIPAVLPDTVCRLLSGLECDLIDEEDMEREWLMSIEDQPNPGLVRPEIKSLVGP